MRRITALAVVLLLPVPGAVAAGVYQGHGSAHFGGGHFAAGGYVGTIHGGHGRFGSIRRVPLGSAAGLGARSLGTAIRQMGTSDRCLGAGSSSLT